MNAIVVNEKLSTKGPSALESLSLSLSLFVCLSLSFFVCLSGSQEIQSESTARVVRSGVGLEVQL